MAGAERSKTPASICATDAARSRRACISARTADLPILIPPVSIILKRHAKFYVPFLLMNSADHPPESYASQSAAAKNHAARRSAADRQQRHRSPDANTDRPAGVDKVPQSGKMSALLCISSRLDCVNANNVNATKAGVILTIKRASAIPAQEQNVSKDTQP